MAERFVILFIALIFCGLDGNAQVQKKPLPELPGRPIVFNERVFRQDANAASLPAALAPDQAVRRWGLVCRKEWALEKSTGVPFRFRLGSVDYTDRLEGKTKGPSASRQ